MCLNTDLNDFASSHFILSYYTKVDLAMLYRAEVLCYIIMHYLQCALFIIVMLFNLMYVTNESGASHFQHRQWQQACEAFEEVYTTRMRVLGDKHVDTILAKEHLDMSKTRLDLLTAAAAALTANLSQPQPVIEESSVPVIYVQKDQRIDEKEFNQVRVQTVYIRSLSIYHHLPLRLRYLLECVMHIYAPVYVCVCYVYVSAYVY